MEKHFFFISLRKTLFLTATFVLLIGNTQPSYAMLGVDEELQVMPVSYTHLTLPTIA